MNKLVPTSVNRRLSEPSSFELNETKSVRFGTCHAWSRETKLKPVKGAFLYIHGSGGNRAWPSYR